tara:strand:+ start:488 stop:865 length:378 start_codon:yes stop_codon:yes gene_type:complete
MKNTDLQVFGNFHDARMSSSNFDHLTDPNPKDQITETMNTTENNKLIAEFDQKYSIGFGLYDFDGSHYKMDELEFHKSWDWLMPVINKCYQEHMSKNIAEAVMTCDINEAYKAVLEFIEYHNEEN